MEENKWDNLIKHPDYEINIKNMNLMIKDGVFTPDPKITNSALIIINNLPKVKDLDVLDVGCGTGIIGIYCALKGAKNVLAVDNSDKALENTRINLKKNNLKDRVKVVKSNLFENVNGKFDYIFANLPILDEVWDLDVSTTNTVQKYILECKDYVKKGGKVYFTWASFSDITPLRELCSKLDYSYKEISENKSGIIWYLIELSF